MDRLLALYNIASPSGREKQMAQFIRKELKRMDVTCRMDRWGNLYAVKGNARTYPCVVAHMDEVHRNKTGRYGAFLVADEMIIGYDYKNRRMTGIGADDKNGIWMCLKCLKEFEVMKCAFFVQEETGCIGSGQADMDFFSDCRFVIQCDRKGNSDIITCINGRELCSDEFINKINPEKYGYLPTRGASTDVHTLKVRGLDVSCINLSCGYYKPHTDNEYTIVEDLYKCFRFVCHIIRCHKKVSRHEYIRPAIPDFCWSPFDWEGYREERLGAYGRRTLRKLKEEQIKKSDICIEEEMTQCKLYNSETDL